MRLCMGVDILEHEFVPSHEVLPKKDAKELLESLGTTINKLPKILLTDPVIKRLGAKQGDVLRISRNSPTAGKSFYYRTVV